MLPGLQPSRPKPPQQSARVTFAHQQQRGTYDNTQPRMNSQPPIPSIPPPRPRCQVEAMPPSASPQQVAMTNMFTPLYDSAIRHPVFFTQTLKKPPFPIPQVASQGWNPVASGYIAEQKKVEANGRTKL